MPSLLLVVFAVELSVHLVNTFGASAINSLLWNLFLALPTQISKDFAKKRKLQADYLKTRRELNATSSQDQFAKWAKLRRQHDKQLEQLEKMKSSQDSIKTQFDRVVTALRWIGTRGVQFLLPFWYAKQPMLWLPYGWFPYYVEWLMSFPRAPLGSVSIAAWQLACTSVIIIVSDGMKALLALVFSAKQRPEAVPAKESNEKTGSKEATKGAEKEKKDT